MRKIVKEAEYCPTCKQMTLSPEDDYFCDNCKKRIRRKYPLTLTVYMRIELTRTCEPEDDNPSHEFCSWKCVREFLSNLPYEKEKVWFINLPDISEQKKKGFDAEYKRFLKEFLGFELK